MTKHESATVAVLPNCDFHPTKPAVVDGKTMSGPWAFMCDECFEIHGVGLGLGRGQRLVVKK